MIIHSEQEMLKFAEDFASTGGAAGGTPTARSEASTVGETAATGPVETRVIELIGDVGAGKTTFVRGLAKGLGIKEPITSPSFTISKTYALPTGGHFIHYDFYRLSDPGLMLEDLAENLANPENIVVIEWGESIKNILPENRTTIKILINAGGRDVSFEGPKTWPSGPERPEKETLGQDPH